MATDLLAYKFCNGLQIQLYSLYYAPPMLTWQFHFLFRVFIRKQQQ